MNNKYLIKELCRTSCMLTLGGDNEELIFTEEFLYEKDTTESV